MSTVLNPLLLDSKTHLPASEKVLSAESEAALLVSAPLTAAAACISTATSRGVLGPLSGDDSCEPLVQFKGWLECNKTVLKADQDERNAFRNKYTHNNTTYIYAFVKTPGN